MDPGCAGAETRQQVKDQLEALILQMYKSNILYSEAVSEFKKRFIITVLEENRGNQCKAARQLGMHRNTLSRTMHELKIDVRPLRAGAKRPPRSARPAVTLEKRLVR
jgi:DNA-binding NtrC family response regulator